MTSSPSLADLGVVKTRGPPYVFNDKPFSEARFMTMNYRGRVPQLIRLYQDGRRFCQEFFPWYN